MKIIIGVEQDPRAQFTIEVEERDGLPDTITLPDGSLVMLVGRYASPGDRFSYRRVSRQMTFSGPVHEWKQYTKLTGEAP